VDFIEILVLGLVQGITEWVPISSKTQDTFVYAQVYQGDMSTLVPVLLYLHIGTLLSAVIYFRGELIALARECLQKQMDVRKHARGTPGFLFTSLLFTGIVGIPLLVIEKIFLPGLDARLLFVVMGLGLVLTGILLALRKGTGTRERQDVGWRDGVLTGIMQGLSVLPGISRSGTSTTGLIWRGFDAESSFHLSFLLSIPTVIVAELFLYVNGSLAAFPVADGIALALSSFAFGYLTLGILLKIVSKVNLAYVALALGALMAAAGLLGQA